MPRGCIFHPGCSHYPHSHRELDTEELRYGHFEDPLPSIASLHLPVDMQGRTHHISGYRLLNWSPAITQNARIDRASLEHCPYYCRRPLLLYSPLHPAYRREFQTSYSCSPQRHYSRFTGRIRHSFAALSSHSIRLLSYLYLSGDAPPDSYFSLCP